MKEKVINFDISADKLLDLAEAKLDAGEYLAALRFLHKSLELYGPGVDEYADLAEAYEGMEVFEQAADCWFQYLDLCAEEEAVDAYEGLAICYYNLGNEPQALYYYNKMVRDKYVSPSNNIELGELLGKPATRARFRVSWPPESADYSEEIDEGLRALRMGECAKAEECFQRIPEGSEYFVTAQNYLAVSYLLGGESKKAEEVCLAAMKAEPDNVQALSTYAAVLVEQERREESRVVAERLAKIETENPDELYKIATVCCENRLYKEAYEKFCILEDSVHYDRTLLFFKSVAALRSGKVKESLASMGKILDVYPDAEVARYYYGQIRAYAEGKDAEPEVSFFYRLPTSERDARVKLLKTLHGLPMADLQAYCTERDISELLRWCFDESDGQDAELQLLAVAVAVRADLRPFIADILLKSTVNDVIKIEAVYRVCERNREFECGIVIADIYRKIGYDKLEIGRAKRMKFVHAYALCFARYALFGDGRGEEYRAAAESMYTILEKEGKLDLAADADSLTAALYLSVSPNALQGGAELLQRLHADANTVSMILRTLQGEKLEEAAITQEEKTEDRADEAD